MKHVVGGGMDGWTEIEKYIYSHLQLSSKAHSTVFLQPFLLYNAAIPSEKTSMLFMLVWCWSSRLNIAVRFDI